MVGSVTLLEFIERRLQDDQDRALAAAEILRCGCHGTTDAERASWSYEPLDDGVWHTSNLHPVFRARQWEAGHLEDEIGEHVAAHDPARVLREVEAKRRLLALHPHRRFAEPLGVDFDEDHRVAFAEPPLYVGCEACHYDHRREEVRPGWWCDTVLLLAAPYADHPDYDPSWSPS